MSSSLIFSFSSFSLSYMFLLLKLFFSPSFALPCCWPRAFPGHALPHFYGFMPWEHSPLLLGECHKHVEAKRSRCTKTIQSCNRLGKTCADVRCLPGGWVEVQLSEGLLAGGELAGGNEGCGERGLGEGNAACHGLVKSAWQISIVKTVVTNGAIDEE